MPPHGKIGMDSFARTDTQKNKKNENTVHEQAQNNRHRKRQKPVRQLMAQKQPGGCRMQGSFGVQLRKRGKVSSYRNSLGSGAVIPKRKVRQKGENRGKASRLHGKVQEVSLKER